MKHKLSALFLVSFSVFSNGSIDKIDIDCDGIDDDILLSIVGSELTLSISASSVMKQSSLQFGIGQSSRQDAICGLIPELSSGKSATEEMHMDMFDQLIEGYKYSSNCNQLIVSGKECDPIYVFFNHKTGVLNWLRL